MLILNHVTCYNIIVYICLLYDDVLLYISLIKVLFCSYKSIYWCGQVLNMSD